MSNIPKIIHQIWYQGEANIPDHLRNYRQSWMDKHPNYQFVLWDQSKIESLVDKMNIEIKELYHAYDLMIQRIDFAKYIILYIFGGIYIDMDVKCLKSLDTIYNAHPDKNVILSLCPYNFFHSLLLKLVGLRSNENLINNGVIACIPQHALLRAIIVQAGKNKNTVLKNLNKNFLHIFYTTGPVMVTQAFREFKNNTDITILDNTYFEACDIDSVKNGCVPPSHAVALHVYEGSWMSSHEKWIVNIYFFIEKYFVLLILISIAFAISKYLKKPAKRLN